MVWNPVLTAPSRWGFHARRLSRGLCGSIVSCARSCTCVRSSQTLVIPGSFAWVICVPEFINLLPWLFIICAMWPVSYDIWGRIASCWKSAWLCWWMEAGCFPSVTDWIREQRGFLLVCRALGQATLVFVMYELLHRWNPPAKQAAHPCLPYVNIWDLVKKTPGGQVLANRS